mgnify:CR=1 FL=1
MVWLGMTNTISKDARRLSSAMLWRVGGSFVEVLG